MQVIYKLCRCHGNALHKHIPAHLLILIEIEPQWRQNLKALIFHSPFPPAPAMSPHRAARRLQKSGFHLAEISASSEGSFKKQLAKLCWRARRSPHSMESPSFRPSSLQFRLSSTRAPQGQLGGLEPEEPIHLRLSPSGVGPPPTTCRNLGPAHTCGVLWSSRPRAPGTEFLFTPPRS